MKLFIFAILIMASQSLNAQQLQATLSHYSTDNGMASNAISHIVQDDYGYIWLSTWNGLSRFDGYNFYNYQTGAGSHIPHLHNRIMDIDIDNRQNVWMRMYDGRVFVMMRSIDKIVNPFENISGSSEYRTRYPVTVTSAGDVIVNVEGIGLYKMSMEQDRIASQLITTGEFSVTSMAEGYQDDIWLGTDKGVHRIDFSNLTLERKGYFLDESVTCLFSNGYNIFVGTTSGKIFSFSYGQEPRLVYNGKQSITGLFVDSHGVVWFSDKEEGALRLHPESGNEKRFRQPIIMPEYDGIGAEFNEANGILWVRLNRGGYGYYNRETDEIEFFHNNPSNTWNLSNTVNASLELNEGVIWESTIRRGLEKLEILKRTIDRVSFFPEEGPSMNNEIRAILYDARRQHLLMGNKNSMLFILNPDGSRTTITKDSGGKPLGRMYGLSMDQKGNYWLCSKDAGLFLITPSGNGYDIRNFIHNENDEWSLSDNRVYYALEDREGNVWVATYGGGVNILTHNKNGKEVFLHSKNVMKKYPYKSHQKVRTLALDAEGNVWAGTTDGILVMSYIDRKLSIKELKESERDPDKILLSNDVVCLARDRQGDMWVGTSGGGLAHTVGKDADGQWLFENFGSKDGLPSEEIRSITFDDRGNVWFATDHVLCSFNTSKRIFTTFSTLDGVDDTMCSEGAAVCMPNGNVLFGTVNGYYIIDRSKLVTTSGNILKLHITDFWLGEDLQSPRYTDTYDYYVPESRRVELPSHGTSFTFRFASLNYQLQHRVHYQYMLEGYDRVWKNADRTRTATYSSLPAGTYHFRVKAFLLESPDKYDMRVIEVVVPLYFLFSKNAIWLYMLLAILVSVWLLFWRQRHLEQQERMRMLREGPRIHTKQSVGEKKNELLSFLNDYLDVHYSDPMLTIDEIVSASEMPVDDFVRELHKATGQTPKEYVSDFRLKKALTLLETTDDSIASIAFHCGYTDVAAFNRQFKVKTGIMPSKFRDDQKNRHQQHSATDAYEIMN
jgi:ligand-binding sensor domain-containing protein/AraC-like DNA-binding protein